MKIAFQFIAKIVTLTILCNSIFSLSFAQTATGTLLETDTARILYLVERNRGNYFDIYERDSYVLDIPKRERMKMLRSKNEYFGRAMESIQPLNYESLSKAMAETEIAQLDEYKKEVGRHLSSKKKFNLYSLKLTLVSLLPGALYSSNPHLNLIDKFNKIAKDQGVE